MYTEICELAYQFGCINNANVERPTPDATSPFGAYTLNKMKD